MSVSGTPFLGQVRMFAGSFEPRGWRFCKGQLLNIVEHPALFALLGVTYGGDGKNTFGLPDLTGRAPMHQGQGAGLTARPLGQSGGAAEVTLSQIQNPIHSHVVRVGSDPADTGSEAPGANTVLGAIPAGFFPDVYGDGATSTSTANHIIADTGGGAPHPNEQPYLALNFIICITGITPPHS